MHKGIFAASYFKAVRCHSHCVAQHKTSHLSALRKHAGITTTINVMCLQLHQYILVVGVALCGSRSIKLAFPGRNCRGSPTARSPCEASTLLHRVGRLWSPWTPDQQPVTLLYGGIPFVFSSHTSLNLMGLRENPAVVVWIKWAGLFAYLSLTRQGLL